MHLLVVEGHNHAAAHKDGDFRIEQLIGDACGLRILADTFVGRLLQGFCIAEQITAVIFVDGSFAYLQAVAMPIVIDGENIDQL